MIKQSCKTTQTGTSIVSFPRRPHSKDVLNTDAVLREDFKMLLNLAGLKTPQNTTCSEKQSEAPTAHLPHGFNSFFEEMEVTVACQVPGTYHVAVKPPELLHLWREGRVPTVCLFSEWMQDSFKREAPTWKTHCYRLYFGRTHFHLEDREGEKAC